MSPTDPCPHCGHANPLGSNFCASCGEQVTDRQAPATEALDPTLSSPIEASAASAVPVATGMLIVRQGAKRGSKIALDTDSVTIGRHPESDIFLDDITVSRRHATIELIDSGHRVSDAGSLNGTYVNRDRVEDAILADGDELQVGKFKLVYVALGDDAELDDVEQ